MGRALRGDRPVRQAGHAEAEDSAFVRAISQVMVVWSVNIAHRPYPLGGAVVQSAYPVSVKRRCPTKDVCPAPLSTSRAVIGSLWRPARMRSPSRSSTRPKRALR